MRRKVIQRMNRYKLYKAGIDTNEGINRFCGKAEIYEQYLVAFPNDQNYDAMCLAIRSGDVKAAFSAAHALKGVAGNLSLVKLYTDIIPLVEELRAGSLTNAAGLLKAVSEDYIAVVTVLTAS